ncbi:LAMI_0H16622g1_1 [Lachancea mirantina]|uniref:Pre-mRNA-splicing factor CLF1 n=1 Tax=Lachancea mirantina TaxID=1230905 RepID=A0A1G4KIW2_9SACH|nr:LAMI_0H16622g1_1 [Lachancea mirantina]
MEDARIDITSDFILRGRLDQNRGVRPKVGVEIQDIEELEEQQRRKRAEFEGVLKVKRHDIRQWMRYAKYELEQKDFRRARSIYERALQIDKANVPLWIRYIDSELKAKNVNHARNLLERATTLLPRVDKLWFKYVYVEESLGNEEIVRTLFSRWCTLEPTENTWNAFIDFEIRHQKLENARLVFSRYVLVHPQIDTWLKWADIEVKYGDVNTVRQVYSLGLDTVASYDLSKEGDVARLINQFALWEASQREVDRANALFEVALTKWPSNHSLEAKKLQFKKMFGVDKDVERALIFKRRREYEQRVFENASDFDTWWILLDLVENHFEKDALSVYSHCVKRARPSSSANELDWRRYMQLWLRYVIYMELQIGDVVKVRELYGNLLSSVMPKALDCSEIWITFSQFELRQLNIDGARRIFGKAIGLAPTKRIFHEYIDLEIKLKEFDRVRLIYEKLISFDPSDVSSWLSFAELEENLGDQERCRAIYDLSLEKDIPLTQESQQQVFEAYIEFEAGLQGLDKVRKLYQRYLSATHFDAQVWISWAFSETTFKVNNQEDSFDVEALESSRDIFERAIEYFKDNGDPDSRKAVLEAMLEYEETYGDTLTQQKVIERMPEIVKANRVIDNVEREISTMEFPEDFKERTGPTKPISKLLSLAHEWKKKKATGLGKNGP